MRTYVNSHLYMHPLVLCYVKGCVYGHTVAPIVSANIYMQQTQYKNTVHNSGCELTMYIYYNSIILYK